MKITITSHHFPILSPSPPSQPSAVLGQVLAEIGMAIESSAKAVAKLTDADYESASASDPESDPDAPLRLGQDGDVPPSG